MLVTAMLVGVGLVVELFAAISAPVGYQDDNGFHVGMEDAQDRETPTA